MMNAFRAVLSDWTVLREASWAILHESGGAVSRRIVLAGVATF